MFRNRRRHDHSSAHDRAQLTEVDPVGLRRFGHLSDRIVVVDTETTGVYSTDRVVEVAVITLDLDGRVVDEWDTLVNPQRDVGPTWLHGISASMVADAPTFDDIASVLAARLHGALVCAHNLPFDANMLTHEFDRLSIDVTFGGMNTLDVARGKLGVVCAEHGITLDGAHAAMADARATAQLLVRVAARFDDTVDCTRFHTAVPRHSDARFRPRDGEWARASAPPSWLSELTARVSHQEAPVDLASYLEVLDRAMADLHLDQDERTLLASLAHEFGIDGEQIGRAHRQWLVDVIETACEDGIVDDSEYDQLLRAAHVLDVDSSIVEQRTITHRTTAADVALTPGMGVWFTGAATDSNGRKVEREELAAHAEAIGLVAAGKFTKSTCALLVAADPSSQSGKAANARKWGIPIIGVTDFLTATDAGVVVAGHQLSVGGREASTCVTCHSTFTRPSRGKRSHLCRACS